MVGLSRFKVRKQPRIERQSGHIFHNPIFGLGLRFFVDFRRNLVAVRQTRVLRASLGASLRARTTGFWWEGGHPANPDCNSTETPLPRCIQLLANHLRLPLARWAAGLKAGRRRCYSEHTAWTE